MKSVQSIKALTLHQPWAELMAHGIKTIETRSWRTNYRGPLAIHAGRREMDKVGWELFRRYHLTHVTVGGAILAFVNLVDCIPVEKILRLGPERDLGDYSAGRFAWITSYPRLLVQPVEIRGWQGLWNLDTSTLVECDLGQL